MTSTNIKIQGFRKPATTSIPSSKENRQVKLSIHQITLNVLTCYRHSQTRCLLLRPLPRRRKSPPHDLPLPMLSHANTPFIYTSEYVLLHEYQISCMKSTLWPRRGYLGRKTDPWGYYAGARGSVQEESTKGHQRNTCICHEGDGTWTTAHPFSIPLLQRTLY